MIKYLTPQAQGSIPTIQPAVHGSVVFAWLHENWAQGPGTNVDILALLVMQAIKSFILCP